MTKQQFTRSAAAVAAADWGPYLRRAAAWLAVAVAVTYAAGYISGQTIHRLNDYFAGIRPADPAPAVILPAAPSALAAPLTVAQLRAMARQRLGSAARPGGRRIAQARRADLLAALGAE